MKKSIAVLINSFARIELRANNCDLLAACHREVMRAAKCSNRRADLTTRKGRQFSQVYIRRLRSRWNVGKSGNIGDIQWPADPYSTGS